MPDNDQFSCTCVGIYQGVTINNVVHLQVTSETNGVTVMADAAEAIRAFWMDTIRTVQTIQYAWRSIVVRRLAPAIPDVFVQPVTLNGNKAETSLPSTCVYLVRYYCEPYEKSSSYHWKIAGVGAEGNNAGNLTDGRVVQFDPFFTAMISGPYTVNGNEFQFVAPHKRTDPPGLAKPVIRKISVDGKIRNLRSRQVYA